MKRYIFGLSYNGKPAMTSEDMKRIPGMTPTETKQQGKGITNLTYARYLQRYPNSPAIVFYGFSYIGLEHAEQLARAERENYFLNHPTLETVSIPDVTPL